MKKIKNTKTSKLIKRKDAIREVNDAYLRTLHWFFSFPSKELSLSDLATEVGMSKTTATIVVQELINQGFLKQEVLGRTWRLSCNQQHFYLLTRKVPYHLSSIYESGIIEEIRKIVGNPRAIVLFGSYRRGDDIEQSDIDIAVELVGNDDMKIVQLGRVDIGYRKGVLVNLHVFTRNKIDLNLFANIANGIVLEGFLEARP